MPLDQVPRFQAFSPEEGAPSDSGEAPEPLEYVVAQVIVPLLGAVLVYRESAE